MARKKTSHTTEIKVLDKSRRRCALCFYFNNDIDFKKGQIAHIDRNSSNSIETNLAYLCIPHHDEYDTRSNQSKRLQPKELKLAKDNLELWIEKNHSIMSSMTTASLTKTDLPDNTKNISPSVYNLRLPVYEATYYFVSLIMQEAKISYKELFQFYKNVHNTLFLFGEDIDEYCRLLYTKGIDLHSINVKMERPHSFEYSEWTDITSKEMEILHWFSAQLKEMKRIFYPYLKLGNKYDE
jgi:uncharacterized ubiquitin-like protein YukD